jgi:hypothetical protein
VSITYFEYHDVGSSLPIFVPMSLSELAVNIVTDWMPGVTPGNGTGCQAGPMVKLNVRTSTPGIAATA